MLIRDVRLILRRQEFPPKEALLQLHQVLPLRYHSCQRHSISSIDKACSTRPTVPVPDSFGVIVHVREQA